LLALSVALERRIGVVKAATVGFDNQPGISPEEIGHRAATARVERHVDLRLRQSSALAHTEEEELHVAPRPLCQGMYFVHHHPQASDTSTSATAPDQLTDGNVVENPQHLGLRDGLPQFPNRSDRREVQQGTSHTRARDAMHFGSIGWSQRFIPMCLDPFRNASPSIGRRYIDRSALILPQPPQRGGRAMRQHRIPSTCKHCRHELHLSSHAHVPDCVNAMLNSMQRPDPGALPSYFFAHPYVTQLLK
jgi:hypothetical protein